MISKNDLKKITDYIWEIPKSFRQDMRVPARIFISDKMIEELFKDRTLWQLVNISTLPGIQKWALVMPDAHEGYGFPIGGVAAISTEDGVISPGGIGYDINCIHPDIIISLPFGTNLKIKDLFLDAKRKVMVLEKSDKKIKESSFINYFFRREEKFLYSITTKFGFNLKATGDHPIYNGRQMIKTELLNNGDNVIINPFSGIFYEESKDIELINREKIIKALKKMGFKNNGNRYRQILNWFNKRGFLNLKLNSWQMPYLIKILGLLFGDGTMNFIGKDLKGHVMFYGKKEDLKAVQMDLTTIGIKSKIYKRLRNHKIKTHYNKIYKFFVTEYSLHINSKAFVILLYLLGAPIGNKTAQKFFIPSWLWDSPLWHKRLFIAAFFGAEMSKPATINKYNFYSPTLNINKIIPLKNNGIKFLEELRQLLVSFDVKTSKVVEVEGLSNKGKTIGLRFQIYSTSENLIKFFKTIGFEYNKEKQKLANLAIAYLQYKEKIIQLRKKTRFLVRNFYRQRVLANELIKTYASQYQYIDKQFIEHSLWSKKRFQPRISFNFPSFEEFVRRYSYGNEGLIVDEIESIEKELYSGLVYDITVGDKNHNFIANNFIVSNCGVRLLKSKVKYPEIKDYLKDLTHQIQRDVPSGLGRGHRQKLSKPEFDKILKNGAKEIVGQSFGIKEDLEFLEANGCLEIAEPSLVSDQAKSRGYDQVGTIGSGNHFLEIQRVDEIFYPEAAKIFGLEKDQVVILIHTGSRGLGHQIATDYIRIMMKSMPKYGIVLPDRELACAPFRSEEGQNYLRAMACGANFAWANRQMITHLIRKAWQRILGDEYGKLDIVYDVAHNIAKIETYEIDGKKMKLCIHRKGATRAFGPKNSEIPAKYQEIGQPVLIPGSMGTASFVLVGTKEAEKISFSTTCHGAGRRMSRHQAKRQWRGQELKQQLEKQGIIVGAGSMSGLAEEAPLAYKDVEAVVDVVDGVGIAKKVARLKPLAVIKG